MREPSRPEYRCVAATVVARNTVFGHYSWPLRWDVTRCQLDLGSLAGRYTIFVPYAEHPVCETPKDEVVLWRYMDFVKFIALLDSTELRFTRLDHLNDPREGMLTDVELVNFQAERMVS